MLTCCTVTRTSQLGPDAQVVSLKGLKCLPYSFVFRLEVSIMFSKCLQLKYEKSHILESIFVLQDGLFGLDMYFSAS